MIEGESAEGEQCVVDTRSQAKKSNRLLNEFNHVYDILGYYPSKALRKIGDIVRGSKVKK